MRGQLGGRVDHPLVGRIDPQSPGVQVHLAADPTRQKCFRAAIFGIPDDRVAERRHVRAKLVGAPGQRLQFHPRRSVSGSIDHPPAGPRRLPVFLVDVHLLAAGPRLLGERQVDQPLLDRGHSDHQRPIHLARGPPGKALGEIGRRPGRARNQQHPAGILVEPVDQLGPIAVAIGKPVEQPVEVLIGLGPTLRREPRHLVENEGMGMGFDHHLLNEGLLVGGQRHDIANRPTARDHPCVKRRKTQRLPGLEPVSRRRALAVDPQLAGPRQPRDAVEGHVGKVPLEPAVKPDPVVVVGNGKASLIAGHAAGPSLWTASSQSGSGSGVKGRRPSGGSARPDRRPASR